MHDDHYDHDQGDYYNHHDNEHGDMFDHYEATQAKSPNSQEFQASMCQVFISCDECDYKAISTSNLYTHKKAKHYCIA